MTADAEWLECEFVSAVPPDEVQRRLEGQLPLGIGLLFVEEAPWKASALASRLRASAYELFLHEALPEGALQARVDQFLQASTWVVEERHKERARTVDLRQLVSDVQVGRGPDGQQVVRAVLHQQEGRSARLETLLGALGIGAAALVHRRWLVLGDAPAAGHAGGLLALAG
jgi:radical SAM-linked protein